MTKTKSTRLLYGKSDIERIVSIEVKDNKAFLFRETPEGNIETQQVDNRFWVLSPEKLNDNFIRLKGDLHYKWGIQFPYRKNFTQFRFVNRDRDLFSIYNPKESLMVKDGYTYFKGMRHNEVSVMAFDIESTGLVHDDESDVLLIACTLRKRGVITRKLFAYDEFPTRKDMLDAFCAYVREMDPSILLGHNIFSYDLPYLAFVAGRNGTELKLGRDGSAIEFERTESKFRKDSTQFYHYKKAHVFGRELVDTLFLSIRYDVGRKWESYALKSIISAEHLEVPGRVHYDASRIRHTYKIAEEWSKIKQYASFDGDDALTLWDLTSPPFFYIAQSVPKPFQLIVESASGSQINAVMMRSYLQEAHSLPKANEAQKYEGAISFGNPGVYRNVFKVDVASLYPNIMREFQVYDPEKDPEGNFLRLVEEFTKRRLEHKKLAKTDKYYDDLQNAEKIFINSCYGFLGATGLLFNSPARAAFVTQKGREILERAIRWAESRHFHIVNADTDSISFCEGAGALICEQQREDYLTELNALFPEKIRFEDDGYYDVVIVLAGKNYVLSQGGKNKLKGSAIKATTKEPALQQYIKETIKLIMHEGQLSERLRSCYDFYAHEILNIQDIRRWSTRKTITEKVLNASRTNEQKVKDAIVDSEYVEGDRAYFYFRSDNSLCLAEKFDGDYNRERLLEKLYRTAEIFDSILDVKKLFPNYKLKRNKKLLEQLALF